MKGNMMLIIIAVASLVGGGAGGYFARGMLGAAPAAEKPAGDGAHGEGDGEHASEDAGHEEEESHDSSGDHGGGDHGGGEKKAENDSQLGPFIVNLADDGARRYLRATLQLGLRKESYKKYFEKVDPRVRDALLLTLSSRRTGELLSPEGKTKLREEIAEQLNTIIGKEVVDEVYFVDFLIQ
jgi:flagellar basal body-associated protein FliL